MQPANKQLNYIMKYSKIVRPILQDVRNMMKWAKLIGIVYEFVRYETGEIIQNVLQAVCDMMGDTYKTRTVMLDKDKN